MLLPLFLAIAMAESESNKAEGADKIDGDTLNHGQDE